MLLVLGCSSGSPEGGSASSRRSVGGLPAEGQEAAEQLKQALATHDVAAVGAAGRAASAWKGQDPALDRMLGDALANVLMRPTEGLPLLIANPAPEDPAWRDAVLGAATRAEDMATVANARALLKLSELDLGDEMGLDLLAQVGATARRHPELPVDELERVVLACRLLDRRPRTGRQRMDSPVPRTMVAGAVALGATRVVMARPEDRSDRDPTTMDAPYRCTQLRLIEGADRPEPLPPRGMLFAAEQGEGAIFIDTQIQNGEAWAYGASDVDSADRWLSAAELVAGGEGARVEAVLGRGLMPPTAP